MPHDGDGAADPARGISASRIFAAIFTASSISPAFSARPIEPLTLGAAQARLVLFGPRVGELRAGLVVTRVLGLRNLAELLRSDAAGRCAGVVRRALDRQRTAASGRKSTWRCWRRTRAFCKWDCSSAQSDGCTQA